MSEIVIFEDESQPVEVRLEGETVWLTQKQMAELFGKDLRTVNEHVGNVYQEGGAGPGGNYPEIPDSSPRGQTTGPACR